MKKSLILIGSIVICFNYSCAEPQSENEDPVEHNTELLIHQLPEGDLEFFEIEGCEYIIFKDGMGTNHGFGYMTHKGNCKNPIHIYRDTSSLNTGVKDLQ
ncbi:MAG: hypothetical protein HKN67_08675 [Saprospiraceae bacterium]|nr:hypothetical protein [Saprospiraceae bacterium]